MSAYSRMQSSFKFQLFSNVLSPMVNQTKLFYRSLQGRAIQVFKTSTSTFATPNLIASVGAVNILLGHHLTYENSFLVYLPLPGPCTLWRFVGMLSVTACRRISLPRSSQIPLSGAVKKYKGLPSFNGWLAGKNTQKGIV